ncbi:DUF4097 family beta strand repeat protein [Sedimentibacter sp. zth1]|uniref:DUF4097 family beta strand repeat-containing protein n=1 Tax=Sedimentibacter sp. zth1 TaxID=2816908 RepID=UPI001A939912|nr:DUF4097 family beta strand repeat-containing protein [Sedimentibacter sp. zth1]QSX06591.1 DUF4097 family beta strand repeat protein [Sedimentibacter sp. zth1]
MKNRKLLTIASLLVIIGIIIFFVGFANADFNIKNISTIKYEEKSYSTNTNIEKINIGDYDMSVDITPSPDDKIHIKYYENKKRKYIISEKNGVLDIQKEKPSIINIFSMSIDFNNTKLSVKIPKNYNGELIVKTSNNSISISDINLGDVSLTTSNGKIHSTNISCSSSLELKSSNASIDVENVKVSGDIICDTSNGKTNLTNVSSLEDIRCETSNGTIYVVDTKCNYINAKSSNGTISLDNFSTNSSIEIRTSNSKVLFNNISFNDKFKITTSNGKIKGNLNGKIDEYTINYKTSNGDSNLPNDYVGGNKQIDFRTSNSDIDVDFTK